MPGSYIYNAEFVNQFVGSTDFEVISYYGTYNIIFTADAEYSSACSNSYQHIRPAVYLNPNYVSTLTEGAGSEYKPLSLEEEGSNLEVEKPIASPIEYSQQLEQSVLTGGKIILDGFEIKGSFAWADKSFSCKFVGGDYYPVIFTPDNEFECSPFTIYVPVIVNKGKSIVEFPTFTTEDYPYGTKLSDIKINNNFRYGYFTWENPNQEIVSGNNICRMKFSPYSQYINYFETIYKDYVFVNSTLPNSFETTTVDKVEIGDTYSLDFIATANFYLKKVNFNVKYPIDTEIESITNKEFTKLSINSTTVEDGYNISNITAEYTDGDYVEPNMPHKLLAINFKTSENATLGKKEIKFYDVKYYDTSSTLANLTDTITLTPTYVVVPIKSLVIDGPKDVYNTASYTCTIYPENAANKTFYWAVSDESVAEISEDGVLTALKNGTVNVIAMAGDGSLKYESLTVTVHVIPTIASLSTNIGVWDTSYNSNSNEYVIYVDEASENIILNAVFSGGTLKINNEKSVTSGKTVSYSLTAKTTVLTLKRIGTDGTTNEYILKIIKGDGCAFDAQYINEETSYAFDVQIRDEVEFDNAVIVIAGYDENGKFSSLNYKNVTSKDREYAVDFESKTKLASFKVMLWDSLQNMNPISRVKKLTESTKKQSAQVEISETLESSHNYSNNLDETNTYTYPEDCESIDITFNSSTKVENGYDYIYIYDASDNQIGKYTGTILAGQTIRVPGNTVKIRLTSDSGISYYGYKTEKIVVNLN